MVVGVGSGPTSVVTGGGPCVGVGCESISSNRQGIFNVSNFADISNLLVLLVWVSASFVWTQQQLSS